VFEVWGSQGLGQSMGLRSGCQWSGCQWSVVVVVVVSPPTSWLVSPWAFAWGVQYQRVDGDVG
jgi:uncharacterized membrane protein YjgN (DUF898 family)